MTALFNSIARIAKHEVDARPVSAIGRVIDVHESAAAATDYAVSVELRDTGLTLPNVPIATSMTGFASLPEVDELVIVLFANGDYHSPVVVGRLYNTVTTAPEHTAGTSVIQLPPGSKESDASLSVKIDGNEPDVSLKASPDTAISINGEQVELTVGGIRLLLSSAGGGSAALEAGGSKITIKQDGDISMETTGTLKLKATNIELEGSASVKLNGATIELN